MGGSVHGGGRGHFGPAAIYCITTWCFGLKGLRTTRTKRHWQDKGPKSMSCPGQNENLFNGRAPCGTRIQLCKTENVRMSSFQFRGSTGRSGPLDHPLLCSESFRSKTWHCLFMTHYLSDRQAKEADTFTIRGSLHHLKVLGEL